MERSENKSLERIERLVESLELVSSRILETAITNSQLASSQTPQMRGLFDTWIDCLASEVEKFFDPEQNVAISDIAAAAGISRETALGILLALDRMGRLTITGVTASKGRGKNREICDCLS
jgi:hypothetical protein